MTRMRHPHLGDTVVDVPESAVGEHARAGWLIAADEEVPVCTACGQPLPVAKQEPPPGEAETPSEAPAQSGASASKSTPRRRTSSSKEGD